MRAAIEQFFGKGIVDDVNFAPPDLERSQSRPSFSQRRSMQLRRTTTGVSSLVGEGNGERPGGYSLVIEGSALTHVGCLVFAVYETNLGYKNFTGFRGGVDRRSPASTRHSLQHRRLLSCVAPAEGSSRPFDQKRSRRDVSCHRRWSERCFDDSGSRCWSRNQRRGGFASCQLLRLSVLPKSTVPRMRLTSCPIPDAIAQFKYLKRLLLVHGHWSYLRNSEMFVSACYLPSFLSTH